MTSTDHDLCYASVTDTLFEHIEQDLLSLTTALLDDDGDDDEENDWPGRRAQCPAGRPGLHQAAAPPLP